MNANVVRCNIQKTTLYIYIFLIPAIFIKSSDVCLCYQPVYCYHLNVHIIEFIKSNGNFLSQYYRITSICYRKCIVLTQIKHVHARVQIFQLTDDSVVQYRMNELSIYLEVKNMYTLLSDFAKWKSSWWLLSCKSLIHSRYGELKQIM